jgi:hypothetical protein
MDKPKVSSRPPLRPPHRIDKQGTRQRRRKRKPQYVAAFFFLFAIPLFLFHGQLLSLPFFWDEHGQFIPTALDLLRTGAWVAHSAVPNVHPPGVEAYLVLWYKLFGYSIPITRIAMLLMASFGLLFTFLLAIELSQGAKGAPAFLPPLLLLASPLFYTQSMMAQLDMPSMVLTLLALLLFIKQEYAWAAVACVGLVLAKETGITVPFVLFLVLCWRKDWLRAAFFAVPALVLAAWLMVLHGATGYWLGDPGFAHYNVEYALHPVHMLFSLARRIYYLFFAEFRWIGTLILVATFTKIKAFRTPAWALVTGASVLTILLVSLLGGAELERYLLPVLPVFYIAVGIALTSLDKRFNIPAMAGLFVGLIVNLFWNPPYPFPFENNYAMVDFVRLQELAAGFVERNIPHRTVATAWPYTSALTNPDFGFVKHKLKVFETGDFHAASIKALPPSVDVLIVYTRTWMPQNGVVAFDFVRRFLRHFYEWDSDVTPEQCAEMGLLEKISWTSRGQTITIYARR